MFENGVDDIKFGETISSIDFLRYLNWSDKTILLIEDDEASALLITEFLKCTQVKLIHVSNKNSLYLREKPHIDLIIKGMLCNEFFTDFELLKQIKTKYVNTPIIACSATVSEIGIKTCYKAGCDVFVTKPVDLNLLVNILTTYI